MSSTADEIRQRVHGCLFGGALGNALGAPVEATRSWRKIAAAHGPSAPSQLAYAYPPPAQITSDIQMTLFVAEGMIRAVQRYDNRGLCDPVGVIRGALMRWCSTQVPNLELPFLSTGGRLVQEPRLHVRRAPGTTNLAVLEAMVTGRKHPERPAPNNSKGCGALTRSAPIGLGCNSAEIAFSMAFESASDTHGHPGGCLAAAYFSVVIQRLTAGETLPQAMSRADDLLAGKRGYEEIAAAVSAARALASSGPPGPDEVETLGQGWVAAEALAIALACALSAEGSRPQAICDAMWRSVLHGGASASTGCLAGQLLGATHGMACLPAHWLAQLELRDVIERIAEDFFRSTHLAEILDVEAYPTH